MSIANLTAKQLLQAANLKDKIAGLEKQIASLIGIGKSSVQAKPAKRGMSAAGRARVAAAQRLRWSKIHAAKGKTAAKPVKKARKKMSAEAKAKISAAAKARWAKIKAEKK